MWCIVLIKVCLGLSFSILYENHAAANFRTFSVSPYQDFKLKFKDLRNLGLYDLCPLVKITILPILKTYYEEFQTLKKSYITSKLQKVIIGQRV